MNMQNIKRIWIGGGEYLQLLLFAQQQQPSLYQLHAVQESPQCKQ